MEVHELNEIQKIQFEGNWMRVDELYVKSNEYLFLESGDEKFWIPISGYNEQAGTIGQVYWDEIQKESEVYKSYKSQ